MIVYSGTKSDFLRDVEDDRISVEISSALKNKMGIKVGKSEFESWNNSLLHMYKVMNDEQIPQDCGVAIEYNVPQTSKRVDFIVSGLDQNKGNSAVVIELKQWSSIESVESKDALVKTYTGGALREVVHPSYQAWSYVQLINDYNSTVQDRRINLRPCCYLHNYIRQANDPIDDIRYQEFIDEAPVFVKGQVRDLRKFLTTYIKYGDNKETLYHIENGKIRPSKSLQDSIASMLKGNKEFVMIDEQKVAYESILASSRLCVSDGKKRTVIVRGGPGTGKTVIAMNLLSQLTQDGQFVQYVSKNSAPRDVFSAKLIGKDFKKNSVNLMFIGSGSFVSKGKNSVNALLVDEAHRLQEKSGMFHNQGENQIKEIINAAQLSVFFIDESQRVTIYDIGSVSEIEKWAKELGSEIVYLDLVSQFRCNGSDGYLSWIDNTLEIRPTANPFMDGIDYDIRIMKSPSEVYDLILEHNKTYNKSRMLAGYCWNWITEGKNDSSVHDIIIDDFEMSWNLGNTSTYAIDDESVNQIGCIHTSQGLEFDYVGVIIGDDMRYENGHIVTDFSKRAKTDKSLFGIKKMYKENPDKANKLADEVIKNTYRTLMTRGMKGCYVYCTDEKLAQYLRERLNRDVK